MDSFIEHDMEDNMAGDETAPGSATKKSNGPKGRALYGPPVGRAQPQTAIQPGATPAGAHSKLARSLRFNALLHHK